VQSVPVATSERVNQFAANFPQLWYNAWVW
jgi:hypothetical protein